MDRSHSLSIGKSLLRLTLGRMTRLCTVHNQWTHKAIEWVGLSADCDGVMVVKVFSQSPRFIHRHVGTVCSGSDVEHRDGVDQ